MPAFWPRLHIAGKQERQRRKEGRNVRSKELADFAGVTVRTLRHYHDLGLLEEPARGANGYRNYRALDAVRVLRIKHFAQLGFSLQQVKEILDGEAAGAEAEAEVAGARNADTGASQPRPASCAPNASGALNALDALDALDAELAEEIKRIEAKRAIIAQMKATGADPDVPFAFAQHIKRLRNAGASNKLLDLERSGLYLLAEGPSLTDVDVAATVRFLDALTAEGAQEYIRLSEALYALPADASETQREAMATEFAQWLTAALKAAYGDKVPNTQIGNTTAQESPSKKVEARGNRGEAVQNESGQSKERGGRKGTVAAEPLIDTVADSLMLDLYDNETLNEAQIDVSERIARKTTELFGQV